jgi:cytosine/adenosine deaminase-related metal-dependent hydrolase
MSDCKHQGVFQLFTDLGVLGPRCLLAHVNYPTRRDLELIRDAGAHVVHCPKSHRFFHRDTAPIQLFKAHDINVCLGTDSLASNDSLDMVKEMHTLALSFPELSAEQIVRMATTAPAGALGREGEIGVLAPEARADLVTFPLQSDSPDPYESVVYAEQPPSHVVVGGDVVIG